MAPARKKARQEPVARPQQDEATTNTEGVAGQQPSASTSPDQQQRGSMGDRRADMAEIARRRAAHFANYQEEGEQEDNIHAGGKEARTLGPWSSAVELVNAREKAAEQRRVQMMEGGKRKDEALHAAWTPSRDPSLGPRQQPAVPSLKQMCTLLLVEYIDCVESFHGLPDSIRSTLAMAVCARRKLTPQVAQSLAADATTELVLPDCSQLDREAMVAVINQVITLRLEKLDLGMCGRGFGDNTQKTAPPGSTLPDEACEVLARAAAGLPGGSLQNLTHLRLGGAYRINDQGLAMVLRTMPNLEHLAIPDACRLTGNTLSNLASLTPRLRHLDISNCRGFDTVSMALHLPSMSHLSHLILDGIPEVDDALLAALAGMKTLTHLSVCLCAKISDSGVTVLAAGLPGLESFRCDKCDKVTDKGLQALGAQCHLKVLSAARLPKLTDAGLIPIIQRGSLNRLTLHGAAGVTDASIMQLAAHCHATLGYLDISFCRHISNEALGHLADTCDKLTTLLVYGCSQLGNSFAHGHSNEALAFGGLDGLGTAITLCA